MPDSVYRTDGAYFMNVTTLPQDSSYTVSDASNNFTVEFWAKPTATHQIDSEGYTWGGLAGQRYLISPGYLAGSNVGMGVSVGTNGVSVYEHGDSYIPALLVWQSPSAITDWIHVAIVYQNKQPKLYINGQLAKTGLLSSKQFVYPSFNFTGYAYGTYQGYVDEMRIWKEARTQQQIKDNRYGTIAVPQTNLSGYWPLSASTGSTLVDISGNNRSVPLNNSTGRLTGNAGSNAYRYGFNGQEKSDEIKGEGNSYTAEFWEYDPRVGRRWNLDPKPVIGISQYVTFNNNPILFSDPLGDTTHLVMYGPGYENTSTNHGSVGDAFKKNAEALKKNIEARSDFDKTKDAVVLVYVPNAKRFLDAVNKKYATGKIASLTVFSHGFASSQSNPDQIGGLSLGGERAGDVRPDGTKVTTQEADLQLRTYNLREINGTNLNKVDGKNFDPKAICTFYGCFVGGNTTGEGGATVQWSMPMIKKYSFAQNFANTNNLTVHAFSGSAVFKQKNGQIYYDGSMIMFVDRKTNNKRLSTYTPYQTPIVSPPPK